MARRRGDGQERGRAAGVRPEPAGPRRPGPRGQAPEHGRRPAHPSRRPGVRSRRSPWLAVLGSLAVVAVLVFGFVLVRWATTPAARPPATDTARIVDAITSVPEPLLAQVGGGSAQRLVRPIPGPPLTGPQGMPEVLYVGAEYCPFCAAQRWPMIIALARFGAFTGLSTTTSSASDVFASTPTFTFHGSTYTSRYLEFVAVEQFGNRPAAGGGYERLEALTPDQQALVSRYDAAPYTSSPGSIPFVDFGNRFQLTGATYSPGVIGGMGWQEIADSLRRPASDQARAILGSANLMTAVICQVTGQQPASVCAAPAVQALESGVSG